jgi:hypothetical protein
VKRFGVSDVNRLQNRTNHCFCYTYSTILSRCYNVTLASKQASDESSGNLTQKKSRGEANKFGVSGLNQLQIRADHCGRYTYSTTLFRPLNVALASRRASDKSSGNSTPKKLRGEANKFGVSDLKQLQTRADHCGRYT